ncbi:uncharacterized protein LOC118832856 isoform X2 [Trichosurus vulpecula]|uniref:uncharacterized protein LOC118832856 isoform X2 n=1 Tax=Trichosurus vulpecula TaxID=9337 RepID=UPI00186B468F|nr:uncharacterized protein LOC118832856 isoform X2 [Trichosurus vulpecula]
MEVLDEFDWEHPLTFTFCELISEEAFERQAVSYTERSLRRLFRSMDRNPALGERVVRKWKQEERERLGLISFLTGRFFQALQGDLNRYNNVGALELQQRLDHLKKKMQKLNTYAQDARQKRRKRGACGLDRSPSTAGSILSRSPGATTISNCSAIPVTYMPRVFGPFPPLSDEQTETLAGPNSEVKLMQLNWTGLSAAPKRSLGLGSTTNPEGSAPTVRNASVFTPPVLLKFQPVQRPQEDPDSDHENKSLDSPSSAPP